MFTHRRRQVFTGCVWQSALAFACPTQARAARRQPCRRWGAGGRASPCSPAASDLPSPPRSVPRSPRAGRGARRPARCARGIGVAQYRGEGEMAARALTFTTLVFANLDLVLVNRSWSTTAIAGMGRNPALWWVVGGTLAFLALVLFVSELSAVSLRPALRDRPPHQLRGRRGEPRMVRALEARLGAGSHHLGGGLSHGPQGSGVSPGSHSSTAPDGGVPASRLQSRPGVVRPIGAPVITTTPPSLGSIRLPRQAGDRDAMEMKTPVRVVHYFDAQRHRVLCEAQGPDCRSTKHARGVTCPTCIELLAARSASAEVGGESVSHAAS